MLKQHVVSNDVTQDHIYALHNQVKHTAKRVREASQGVDHLIDIALKQMTLNVDVVRDFGTVLRSIPFDALSVQDLYRSIRSFYVGLIERYVKLYGKNNPYVISVDHAFDAFLQKCDFVEALPGGLAQFTGLTASIIQDVYHVDLEDIKRVTREMDGEAIPSDEEAGSLFRSQECGLNEDELRDLVQGVRAKQKEKKISKEHASCEAKVDRILAKVRNGDIADETISVDLRLALVDALKQDDREVRASCIYLKGSSEPLCLLRRDF